MEEQAAEYRHINEELKRSADQFGDKNYIVSLHQEKRLGFDQLEARSRKVADFLQTKGLEKSDKVSLVAKNSIEAIIIFFGVLRYGAVINPINSDESQENINKIIGRVKPKIVLHDSEIGLDAALSGRTVLSFSDHESSKDPDAPFFPLVNQCEPCFEHPLGDKQDVAEILFTSGTTEEPKGVAISREALFYMGEEVVDKLSLGPDETLLEYRAYSWASTQFLSIISTMKSGTTLLLAKKFSRSRFAQWLQHYNVTISSGVPTVINMLINQPIGITIRDVPALKFITSSSAPLSVESHKKFESIYGITINQMAGMTEAGWMLGNPPEKRKPGSVGTPFKHKKIQVLNEFGKSCNVGEIGEIVVSGKSMGSGYINTNGGIDYFSAKGFYTGDLGYVDYEGYFYITGRRKDIIIRGGVNISPKQISNKILEIPEVLDAVTIGFPDDIYGEELASFVVLKQNHSTDEKHILNYCVQVLPEFKVPKVIKIIDKIPLNTRGKVNKKALLSMI